MNEYAASRVIDILIKNIYHVIGPHETLHKIYLSLTREVEPIGKKIVILLVRIFATFILISALSKDVCEKIALILFLLG